MKNSNFWLKIVILLSILLASISVVYFYTIYLPKEKYEKVKEEERLRNIAGCVGEVNKNYKERWNGQCHFLDLGDDCSLDIEMANRLQEISDSQSNFCLQYYPDCQ